MIAHVDTLRRRIALTIVAAMLASLVLYALFVQVAGVWAKPPVDQIGLLDQIAATTRIIQAAPPQLREQLSAAASNPALGVLWSEHRSSFELPANGTSIDLDKAPVLHQLLGEAEHKIEVFQPGNWPAESSQARYVLLMQLNDGSWLSFTPPQRSWGMSAALRFAVVVALGLVAAWLVARFATRQLADPLQRFTSAVQRFGTDLNAPAIEIEGPREIRQAIIAYNTMQAKIQQFIAERTLMLASISHDLLAPLTRIRLRCEFIEDIDQQRKLIRDTDEMQSMINCALGFFRDESLREQATTFDLSELLQTVIDDYSDQGIAVAFSGPPHLVYLGRPVGIKRMTTNLLENAVKYARHPRIELINGKCSICIEVSDEGPGIPDSELENVFVPFFRLEPSRNRDSGGVGLGLSSARAMARQHGADLLLRNRIGGGLIAQVELPHASLNRAVAITPPRT
ncbi:two-component sensor histidine kinase [Pseudomonas versuta]|uniref:histidine kinase n=1 Tax=Pseudomonas versuta TaxID=1788301 RepID=A0A853ZS10_9PSED|nr:two-component sensor histidine kinase [Pseudomonas versuta]